jgi:hypothetical protein
MIQTDLLIQMFTFNADLIHQQFDGITHQESLISPFPNTNSLNWLLGHTISARTYPLKYVNAEPVWTDEERVRYRHQSANIISEEEGVRKLDTLLEDFERSQKRLIRHLEMMKPEDLLIPSGFHSNTRAESLVYFQFHEAQHAGQMVITAQLIGKAGAWLR